MSETLCQLLGGTVHEELETCLPTEVCCELPPDTDTGTGSDTGTGTEDPCGDKESELEWVTTVVGPSNNSGLHMDRIESGEIFIGGHYFENAVFGQDEVNETTLTYTSWYTAYAAEYEADGALAWAVTINDAEEYSYVYGVAGLPDGEVYAAGVYDGPATFGPGDPNETLLGGDLYDNDAFLAKYDADGALAWAERLGGTDGTDWGVAAAALSDGSVVVTGRIESSAPVFGEGQVGEVVLDTVGEADVFLARYSGDGELLWVQHAGSTATDWGTDVTALDDDTVLNTGEFNSYINFDIGGPSETTLYTFGTPSMFLAAYQPDGSFSWAKRAGTAVSNDVEPAGDGGALVVGRIGWWAVFGEGEDNETEMYSLGETDPFAARYLPDGSLGWARHVAVNADVAVAGAVAAFSDGSYVVGGSFRDTLDLEPGIEGGCTLASVGTSDAWLARYTAEGSLVWGFRLGEGVYDHIAGVVVTADGGLVVSGTFYETAVFGEGGPEEIEIIGSDSGPNVFLAQYAP